MKEQLQAPSIFHRMNAPGMYKTLYIFCFLICGAAYGQPTMVSTIPNGSKNFIYVNGNVYFSNGTNLYKGTSTSAPAVLKNTGENILRIYDITLGSYFFFVTQGGSGERLWRSDGTAANTVQITTAIQINPSLVYNGELFLRINSSGTGGELWKVNGTFTASLVKDINPGSGNGFYGKLINHNNLLYFFSNEGTEVNLWKSDGTTVGTIRSVDLQEPEEPISSIFSELTSVDGIMYFARTYFPYDDYERVAEIWKTDGSFAATTMVKQWYGDYHNDLTNLTAFNGKLYFFHINDDPAFVHFTESDGTTAGTQHLELVTIDGDPLAMVYAESHLLYYSNSQGFTNPIEKFDGTTTTTVHEFSEYHSGSSWPEVVDLTYTGGRAFFLDYSGSNWPQSESHLYQADLASGVTRPVQEIYGDVFLHNSSNITAANGSVFFTRTESDETSLWYYNPDSSPATCTGTGNIQQEIWTNVAGADVRAFDFSTPPTGTSRTFNSFETSQYYANNYASRMRGTICVPETGYYTFFISSDDQSELYLSTDPREENKRLIAWVYGYTPFRKYDKYPSQKSTQIYLQADRKYYIEARHKESGGNDFVSVGWQLPDGTQQLPIPGERLSAITTPPNEPPVITITSPQADQIFNAPASVNIAADVNDPDGVSYVTFIQVWSNGASHLATFENPPYQYQWNNLAPGSYHVRVTASDAWGAESTADVMFTVEDEPCTGTGTIVREIWRNVPGTSISSIPVGTAPSNRVTLTSLSTQNYYANEYGSRIRGYVCVPSTGAYTFWISGDDNSELWLSTDENPANKSRIAYASLATKVNEWTKYPTQQGAVSLVHGRRYYIEILHKEAGGADHVAVGWSLPDGTLERPIPGNRLIPFEDPATTASQQSTEAIAFSDAENIFAIYPNPVEGGRQISIKVPVYTDGDVNVEIKSMTGASVQSEIVSGATGEVSLSLNPSIPAGIYLIHVGNEKGRWSTKLQVK